MAELAEIIVVLLGGLLLDSHKAPASSWSDTDQRRGEIRHSAERTLAQATKGPDH